MCELNLLPSDHFSLQYLSQTRLLPQCGIIEMRQTFPEQRKLFHSVFSRAQIYTFKDSQTEEARVLLKGFMETPESYAWLARR
jgi:hypothetical protein